MDNGSQGQNNGSQTQTQRGRGRGTQRHLRTARGAQRQRGRGRGTSQVSEQPAADRRDGTAQPQPQVEAQPQGLAGLGSWFECSRQT